MSMTAGWFRLVGRGRVFWGMAFFGTRENTGVVTGGGLLREI